MNVDPAAEALGRTAARWAGANQKDQFLEAIKNMADADPKIRDQVLPIYVGVAALALRAIHQGHSPNQPQNQELAEELLAHLPWSLVELGDVYSALEAISDGNERLDTSSPQAVLSIFMIVGYIIAWYHRGLGYDDPYKFLDALLNTLLEVPDTGR